MTSRPRLRRHGPGALAGGALAWVVWLALQAGGATAFALEDCPEAALLPGYKILLDDIGYAGAAGAGSPALTQTMTLLRSRLEMKLQEIHLAEERRADAPDSELIRVIRCEGRKPRSEADFDESLLQLLDVRKVLLELWGDVFPSSDPNVPRTCDALMSFALIPVKTRGGGSRLWFRVEERTHDDPTPNAILSMLREDNNLYAFASLGLGISKLENEEYDAARELLCRAELELEAAKAAGQANLDMIISYAEDLNADVLAKARADANYSGLLEAPEIGECHETP